MSPLQNDGDREVYKSVQRVRTLRRRRRGHVEHNIVNIKENNTLSQSWWGRNDLHVIRMTIRLQEIKY